MAEGIIVTGKGLFHFEVRTASARIVNVRFYATRDRVLMSYPGT